MNFTDDVSTSSMVVQGGVASAAVVFLHEAVLNMIPYLIVALVLVFVDLYFGINAARHREEQVRLSRAIRRTVGKTFEYLAWVVLSGTLAVAFQAKWIEWIILGIVVGNELLSIVNNYFEIHGKRVVGLNLFKIIGDKVGADLSDVQVIDTAEHPRDNRGRFIKKQKGDDTGTDTD